MLHDEIEIEFTQHGKSFVLERVLSRHYPTLLPHTSDGVVDFSNVHIERIAAGLFGYGYVLTLPQDIKYYLKFDTSYDVHDFTETARRSFLTELKQYIHAEHEAGRLKIDSTPLLAMHSGLTWMPITEGPFKNTVMTLEPFIKSSIEKLPQPPTSNEPDRWSSYDENTVTEVAHAHVAIINVLNEFESIKKASDSDFKFPERDPMPTFEELQNKFLMSVGSIESPSVKCFIEALANFKEKYEAASALPRMLVHGDYHFGNVLKKEDGIYVPIDFNFCTKGTILHEIMFYALYDIVRGAIRAGEINQISSNRSLRAVLSVYDQAFHLSNEDLDLLKYIRLIAWQCNARIDSFCQDPDKNMSKLEAWASDLNEGIKIDGTSWPDLKPILHEIRAARDYRIKATFFGSATRNASEKRSVENPGNILLSTINAYIMNENNPLSGRNIVTALKIFIESQNIAGLEDKFMAWQKVRQAEVDNCDFDDQAAFIALNRSVIGEDIVPPAIEEHIQNHPFVSPHFLVLQTLDLYFESAVTEHGINYHPGLKDELIFPTVTAALKSASVQKHATDIVPEENQDNGRYCTLS